MKPPCVLGIDTSNYTTSVALVNQKGDILEDRRKGLPVPIGGKGIRQSDAVFHHVNHLPQLMEDLALRWKEIRLSAVSVSTRPRALPESYMPCFRAGEGFAKVIASTLSVPLYEFSHQEGHIAAVWENSSFKEACFLTIHISGGTTELLKVDGGLSLLGATKDLSYGQILDRVGVRMGLKFPCGGELDEMAQEEKEGFGLLSPVFMKDGHLNLSGLETQALRILEEICKNQNSADQRKAKSQLIHQLFFQISESLEKWIRYWVKETGIPRVLLAGGVSSSGYLRSRLQRNFMDTGIQVEFGNHHLSSDNAVGIAYLGRSKEWPQSPSPFHS
jgi:N6-L-threonylcarbamoyladenine synthase